MYKWQTKIHLGKQNENNFKWRIWHNNKYHNNSSNNKSALPRGIQPLPRFLSHIKQLLWYFLWIDLSNIRFRFDVVEEKEGTWGQTVLEVLAEFFEAGFVTGSHSRSPRIKLYHFWLRSHVLLTESNLLINTLAISFAATLRLRGNTHTESRDVLVNDFGLFWNLLLIKSSIANSTPPMWLHFPFPQRSRPVGYLWCVTRSVNVGENSKTAL